VERHASPIEQGPLDATALDVSSIPDLRGISIDNNTMSIGAAEPYLSIARHPMVRERCSLLADMASNVGARQIQTRGTLGGNIVSGSPAADGVTALFALDADVVLCSSHGERTVPITSLYSGYRTTVRRPDELVVRVSFRLPKAGALQLWRKVGTRKALSISKVAVAALAELEGHVVTRVGFGVASVAEVVLPLASVRDLVRGKSRSTENVASLLQAAREATDREVRPMDDIRSTARYRRHVANVLVSSFLDKLFQPCVENSHP